MEKELVTVKKHSIIHSVLYHYHINNISLQFSIKLIIKNSRDHSVYTVVEDDSDIAECIIVECKLVIPGKNVVL